MTARLDPQTVLDTREIISRYLSTRPHPAAGRALGLDPSVVSRAITDAYDGRIDHASRWTAAQLLAMSRDDGATMGAIVAASISGKPASADLLPTISALLAGAQQATEAMSAKSPGGAEIVASERQALCETYLHTIAVLAAAVHHLGRGRG